MDLIVQQGGQTKGRLQQEWLPVFQYFFREMGYDVKREPEKNRVELTPILTQKKLNITPFDDNTVSSFRKKEREKMLIEKICLFLETAGTNVLEQEEGKEEGVINLKLGLLEIPHIKEPRLEITQCSNANFKKLVEAVRTEGKKANMKVRSSTENRKFDPSEIKVQIISPVASDDEFWKLYGEKYASILTVGIMAKLLEDAPLSVLSFVPVSNLLNLFGTGFQANVNKSSELRKKISGKLSESERDLQQKKLKKADIFFDYQFLIDDQNSKVLLFGGLHIKNTGTEVLRNPVVCIKTKPEHRVKITGQILPKSFSGTKGVQTNTEGVRGWKYMKENWLEDYEKKGELWICPIHTMEIIPGQTEVLSNLQISFPKSEQETMTVDAFVYFKEDRIETGANNRISISFLKKDNYNTNNTVQP